MKSGTAKNIFCFSEEFNMDTLGMGRFFNRTKVPGKMMLSLHLLGLAAVLAVVFRSPDRIFCALAMLFSSAGDFMLVDELEQCREKLKIKNAFLLGGGSFIAAHILYIATFLSLLKKAGFSLAYMNGGSFAAFGIAAALIVLFAMVCARNKAFSKYPLFLIYVIMLTADCYAALTYGAAVFAERPSALLAPAGAVAFMISDLILGLDVLGGIKKFNPYLWWFYPIGQLLMIIAG